jgi:hypothetical protein
MVLDPRPIRNGALGLSRRATLRAAMKILAITFLALAAIGCSGSSSAQPVPTTCPRAERRGGDQCAVPIDNVCRFEIEMVRSDFCHCADHVWQCGVPLGIDSPSDAPGCPSAHPSNGSACTPPPPQPGTGSFRLGCHYQVRATPDTHDCVCAHFADGRAIWDCARSGGGMPVTTHDGCPARQPVASSLCNQPASAQTDCQYGYNLSTTCNCAPSSRGQRAWHCETHAQPPSPGRMPGQ